MRGNVIVAALAITTIGCKVKLEASMTGFKEDSPDIVVVHVVSEKGAQVDCSAPGCTMTEVPASGEVDLTFPMPSSDGSKTLLVTAKKGPRRNKVIVDLAGKNLPPTLVVDPEHGLVSCQPRDCSGSITLAPSASVNIHTEPGTIFQIGTDKLTAGADGSLRSPLTLALSPPLAQQPLAKICVGFTMEDAKNVITSVPVSVTFPDNVTASAKADLDVELVEKSLAKLLAGVVKGPVLFPWEKPGTRAKGKRAAAFVYYDDCYDAGATGATVADLDVVAVAENSTRVGECTYHSKDNTMTGKMTMYDLNATVYDRITGKKLATKTFAAPKDCLATFYAQKGSTAPEATSSVDKEGVAKWAATFAR